MFSWGTQDGDIRTRTNSPYLPSPGSSGLSLFLLAPLFQRFYASNLDREGNELPVIGPSFLVYYSLVLVRGLAVLGLDDEPVADPRDDLLLRADDADEDQLHSRRLVELHHGERAQLLDVGIMDVLDRGKPAKAGRLTSNGCRNEVVRGCDAQEEQEEEQERAMVDRPHGSDGSDAGGDGGILEREGRRL